MSQPTGGGPPNDPYAGLYRPDPDAVAGATRPLGGYQQPVSAPEDEAEEDRYGWLYRSESDASAVPPPQPAPPQPAPAVYQAPPPPPRERQQEPQPEQRRPSRAPLIVTLVVIIAVLGVAAVIGLPRLLDRGGSDQRSGMGQTGAGTEENGAPYSGDVSAVVPASAATDCQAPPATDDAGDPVKYTPKLMFDGDKATAWRCDGAAEGEQVTFTLPPGTTVGEVGLVNGYTKVDPSTEADRYPEYRRITQVTWTFPDGSKHQQELADGEHKMQTLRVPEGAADKVVLTIDQVTDPGQDASTRDAVLIPEVRFGATT